MKILMVNKFLYHCGGSETYIFKLGNYLMKRGHEVQYFGMFDKRNTVGNRVNAYTQNMDFHNGSILSKINYAFKTIYSIEARKKIRLVLDDFQPDVVHLNNFNYQLTPSIILEIVKWRKKDKRNCKIIFTAHDCNLICPNHMCRNPITNENCEKCLGGHFINCVKGKCIHGSRVKSLIGTLEATFWKINGAYKYIDVLICCSEFLKTKMDSNSIFLSKTIALHNFVDKVEWKDKKKKDYVLYFGRYSKEKGIETLIEVCKMLPEIQFIFAGSGPLEDKINVIKNIKNVGFQNGNALLELIQCARFVVVPSEWYEPFGLTIIESQSQGTPVIGSRIGAIPELIHDNVDGLLFEPGNVDDIVNKLSYLWRNTEINNRFIEACKEKEIKKISDYYFELIGLYCNQSQ